MERQRKEYFMSAPQLYYIRNLGFVGNCLRWWKEGGHGYTCDLNEAWKVTEEAARGITKIRRGEDIAYRVEDVD